MPASELNDTYRTKEVSSNKGKPPFSEFIYFWFTHMDLVPMVHFLV